MYKNHFSFKLSSNILSILICIVLNLNYIPYLYANEIRHLISSSDSLSCIAEQYIGLPIYGEQGSLKLLYSQNPHIENIHRIKKNTLIVIPDPKQNKRFVKRSFLSPSCQKNNPLWETNIKIAQLHEKIDRLEKKVDALSHQAEQNKIIKQNQQQAILIQEPVLSDTSNFFDRRRYYAGFGFLFHKIKGSDSINASYASLLSDLSWKIEFGWKTPMRVNQKYYTHIHSQMNYYRYSEASPNSVLADKSVISPKFHLGMGSNFYNDHLNLELFIGINRQLYFFTPNSNMIEFDGDWIGRMGIKAEINFLANNSFQVGFRPSLEILGLGGFINDGGLMTGTDIYFSIKNCEINLSYDYGQFESIQSEFNTHQIDILYRYIY